MPRLAASTDTPSCLDDRHEQQHTQRGRDTLVGHLLAFASSTVRLVCCRPSDGLADAGGAVHRPSGCVRQRAHNFLSSGGAGADQPEMKTCDTQQEAKKGCNACNYVFFLIKFVMPYV